ncbi:MAG TPA: serine hydrolase [Gemmatimonadaceae bacterium]|jgi:beta-lactamase class A
MKTRFVAVVAGALAFGAARSGAQTARGAQNSDAEQRAILRTKLQADLQDIAQHFGGVFGARVIDLTDSTAVGVNDNQIFPTGSSIKVGLLLELFRESEHNPGLLAERIPVRHADQVGGTGVIQHFADGSSMLSLEDLAVLMITLSDNTATNLLIGRIPMDSVNKTLRGLGLQHTKLQRLMIHPEASARGDENVSTPAEAAALMARLARCDLPVSKVSCDRMRAMLEIPKDNPVKEPLPANVRVAFKPGSVEGVQVVWAYVELPDRPYILTVMTNYGADGTDGGAAIRQASDVAYKYFSRLARSTPFGLRVPASYLRKPPN